MVLAVTVLRVKWNLAKDWNNTNFDIIYISVLFSYYRYNTSNIITDTLLFSRLEYNYRYIHKNE